jgi:hypothetical protein
VTVLVKQTRSTPHWHGRWLEKFYSRYSGRPEQEEMEEEGEDYLLHEFPLLLSFMREEYIDEDGKFRF